MKEVRNSARQTSPLIMINFRFYWKKILSGVRGSIILLHHTLIFALTIALSLAVARDHRTSASCSTRRHVHGYMNLNLSVGQLANIIQ